MGGSTPTTMTLATSLNLTPTTEGFEDLKAYLEERLRVIYSGHGFSDEVLAYKAEEWTLSHLWAFQAAG